MAAGGVYDRNSRIQSEGLRSGVALLRQAADRVALPEPAQSIVIADYGCSTGHNSLLPISTAIDVLRGRSDQQIMVVHTDLPDDDFSTLFHTLADDPDTYTFHRDVYPMAIGCSFYQQLLPADSVSLGWSSWSVAWLSATPAAIPDHVHAGRSADSAVRAAYARQSARDWEDFLAARGAELRPGARLVLVVSAADAEGNAGYELMFDAAWASLSGFVSDGLIAPEEAAAMVMPHFGRNDADLAAPFGATGTFAGLVIEHLELLDGVDGFYREYLSNGDAAAFGAGWAGIYAAGAFPSLATGLSGGSDDPRAADLFARLKAEIAARLADAPGPMRIPVANLVLCKTG